MPGSDIWPSCSGTDCSHEDISSMKTRQCLTRCSTACAHAYCMVLCTRARTRRVCHSITHVPQVPYDRTTASMNLGRCMHAAVADLFAARRIATQGQDITAERAALMQQLDRIKFMVCWQRAPSLGRVIMHSGETLYCAPQGVCKRPCLSILAMHVCEPSYSRLCIVLIAQWDTCVLHKSIWRALRARLTWTLCVQKREAVAAIRRGQ